MTVKKRIEKSRQQQMQTDETNVDTQKYISIPYIPGTSETLRRIFSKHNIECTFHSNNILRKYLSRPKDIVPAEQQNNIVYKIPYRDCEAT